MILKLLSNSNWIPYNKPIAQAYGEPDPAIILSELANKHQYYEAQGELTQDGYFYLTVEKIEQETTLSKHRQTKAINKLREAGLIETDLRGLPATRHFRFPKDFDIKLANFLTTGNSKINQLVSQNFNVRKNTSNKNIVNKLSIGEKEQFGQTATEEAPPSCGQPPHDLPVEERRILAALEKAKRMFTEWPAMRSYMLERAKAKPGDLDIDLELEDWLRYNSSNIMLMQDPAKKINSDFQRWLIRAAKYGKGSTKPAQAAKAGKAAKPDQLQQDRQHYSNDNDKETW